MKRRSWPALAGLILLSCLFTSGRPLRAGERGRTFLTVVGQLSAVEVATDEAQQEWVVGILTPDGDGEAANMRIRFAPPDVLAEQEFALEVGQRVKVRVFSDETPYVAQQIRNEKTGRVLRLRSLRAEPLWDSPCRHHGRGAGHGQHRHGQRPNRDRGGRY